MLRQLSIMLIGLVVLAQAANAWSQIDAKNELSADEREQPTRFKLEVDEDELSIYETELRYRMILKLIGFILLLGILHVVQVKLKINRAYFWFMVGGVIFLFAINSYRPKIDPNQSRPPSNESPSYAPTGVR